MPKKKTGKPSWGKDLTVQERFVKSRTPKKKTLSEKWHQRAGEKKGC